VYCWGENVHGQLGLGEIEDEKGNTFRASPIGITLGEGVTARAIAASGYHTCVLATGGAEPLVCWGKNSRTHLGIKYDDSQSSCECISIPTPITLPQGITPSWIALGMAHTCLISTDGYMHCWG